MDLMALGLDANEQLLFRPRDEREIADALLRALPTVGPTLAAVAAATGGWRSFRGEQKRTIRDPGDPRLVGWTFLLHKTDPNRDKIIELLRPLARWRGMTIPDSPLLFEGNEPKAWMRWLNTHFPGARMMGTRPPGYVLIVASPDAVPFHFQAMLDCVANVGRLDFDSLDDLQTYAEKVLRLEQAREPVVEREALLFATDESRLDPTHFSHLYMARPLADHIQGHLGARVTSIFGAEATKGNLRERFRTCRSALVYTASHGVQMRDEALDVQRRFNGAICCQRAGRLDADTWFGGDDVPMIEHGLPLSKIEPFLEGAAFFQFGCFGYGTPEDSDYAHWLEGSPRRHAEKPFVAALPKRLLAHPRGPILFMGHVDLAFLLGFTDPQAPVPRNRRWSERLAPFQGAIQQLLGADPGGLAMEQMNERYVMANVYLSFMYDQQRHAQSTWSEEELSQLVDNWIYRGDAQNYMVFGDPAAHLRLPEAG
jgi:hypothetical protein